MTDIANDPIAMASWRLRLSQGAARARADISFAAIDAVVVALGYTAALVLRFIDSAGIDPRWWKGFAIALPVIVAVHLGANLLFGGYGHVWEFASVEEAMRLVAASVASGLVLLGGLSVYQWLTGDPLRILPLLVLVVGAGLALGGMGAVRFRSRLFSFNRRLGVEPVPTLVVGTSRSAADFARHGVGTVVRGFVSHNGAASIRKLAGLPVCGSVSEVPRLVDGLGIEQVVIAASVGEQVMRKVVDLCSEVDVRLRVLPDGDLAGGALNDIRDLELTDLLARSTVSTDLSKVASLLRGRRVLVTGAGGSIGAELVRQISGFRPASVLAIDHDETHLYEAALEWGRETEPPVPILCDIRDREALHRLFGAQAPEIVFHAAAHKHVPILEEFPEEAVKTNVVGTANVLDAARSVGADRMILISTDKAVEPTSVMGASKRVAEMLVQTNAARDPGCVCSAVRFGNVLGSRGSVVPTFVRQIRAGGPVTVSDPDMLRYFMTTAEAVELVLQAAALATGGEIFVLDMGEPVRIGDLARRMIRLAGLVPDRDIQVVITGPRPGEKKAERLSRLPMRASAHPKISIADSGRPGLLTMRDLVDTLIALTDGNHRQELREFLHSVGGQEWTPDETVQLEMLQAAGFQL